MPVSVSNVVSHVEDAFCKQILNFDKEKAFAVYNIFQLYLVHKSSTDPVYASRIHGIQPVLNGANAVWLFWSLFNKMGPDVKQFLIEKKSPIFVQKVIFVLSFSVILSEICGYFIRAKLYREDKGLLEKLSVENRTNIITSWTIPLQPRIAQSLYTIGIILNTTLACISPKKALYAINALTQCGCLYRISTQKWVLFKKAAQIYYKELSKLISVDFSYTALLVPVTDMTMTCSHCSQANPNSFFCKDHVLHDTCIVSRIYNKNKFFHNKYTINVHDFYDSNTERHSHSTCEVQIHPDDLPACPVCQDRPFQNFVSFSMDWQEEQVMATVEVAKPTINKSSYYASFPFLDTITACYTLFQTALAHVQRRPEMSYVIYNAQKVFLLGDIFLTVRNYINAYDAFQKKWESSKKSVESAQIDWGKMAAVGAAVLVTTICLTILVASLKQLSLAKAVDLNAILSQFVPKNALTNVSARWSGITPMQRFMHFVYFHRIVSEIALAMFSSKPYTHLSYALMQTYIVFRNAQLRWIVLENSNLLDGIRRDVRALKNTFRFFVPAHSSCGDEETHLRHTMKSIYEYSSKLFQGSIWDVFWVHDKYGMHLGCNVTVVTKEVENCICGERPILDSLLGRILIDTRLRGLVATAITFSFGRFL